MAQVVLKATHGEETHRVSLNTPLSFATVRASIGNFFPHLPSLRITYKDEDGDCITVATDADVNEAIRFFGKNPVKFAIVAANAEPVAASAPAPAPAPVAAPVAAPAPLESSAPVFNSLMNRVAAAQAAATAEPKPAESAPVFNSLINRAAAAQATAAQQPAAPAVRLQARFVRDVTVPDGTVFPTETKFRKTWVIRNAGDCAWPAGCVLRFEAGDQLSGVPSAVPVVQAGTDVELSVDFTSSAKEGKFVSYWRLCNSEGIVFGDRIWTEIKVDKSAAPAPAPAPAVASFVAPQQPPLAPLPVPATVQFAFAFQPALDQVTAMGFPDNERTRRILVKNRGDVPRTMQDLLGA